MKQEAISIIFDLEIVVHVWEMDFFSKIPFELLECSKSILTILEKR
ncbi:hypothetical protein [Borreliella japonica]